MEGHRNSVQSREDNGHPKNGNRNGHIMKNAISCFFLQTVQDSSFRGLVLGLIKGSPIILRAHGTKSRGSGNRVYS